MKIIHIEYDLMRPGQQYDRIIDYIKGHGGWAHVLESSWLISTDKSAVQVRDELLRLIDSNDKVLVTNVSGDAMAWHGLSDTLSDWIKNHVPVTV